MTLAATVIIPTYDHGPTLRPALESALAQTVADIEVFVIGDGVPEVTREIMSAFARSDERVRFFDHPKGPRNGELYRHEALKEACGEIVCYLSDDDLWFPEHVETMQEPLDGSDFVGAHPVHVTPEGELLSWPSDLSIPGFPSPCSPAARTSSLFPGRSTPWLYRRLPEGWTGPPPGNRSVHVAEVPSPTRLRAGAALPTVLHFPSRAAELDERRSASRNWSAGQSELPIRSGRQISRRSSSTVRARAPQPRPQRAHYGDAHVPFRRWLLGPAFGSAAKALARRGARRATER